MTLEHPGVVNPTYRLRTPDERDRRHVLLRELRRALQDSATKPEEVLATVAEGWKKMDRANPAFMEQYRLSLWLSPR